METNGFLILMPLTLIILFSRPIYNSFKEPESLAWIDRTDSLLAWMALHQAIPASNKYDSISFHSFDPNLVSPEGLVALGLDERTAGRIENYRSKGGRFRRKEDVAKIYGLDSGWYRKASPWMVFPKAEKMLVQQPRNRRIVRLDINSADTLQLQDVYGIGPALARRITTFRDRLGGFLAMDQLREVYGLDSVVVERVKKQFEVKPNFIPRLINLRHANVDEFAQHPYVSRRQAYAIVAYRSQHNGIDSVEQLLQIKSLDGPWLTKIRPYLALP